MTLYFPDLNVWLALSVPDHAQRSQAWKWLARLDVDDRFIFSRYTQLGLLPLLSLNMRLGEASGAAVAIAIFRAAAVCHVGMATFDEAAVSQKE